MMAARTQSIDIARRGQVERPPVPREHGAWVILYAPLILAFVAARPIALAPAAIVTVSVTAAFLARNALSSFARRRGPKRVSFWLATYVIAFTVSAAALVIGYGRWGLVTLGLAAGAAFGVHLFLAALPTKKRLDRSAAGELLAVGALSLTGPAGYVSASGRLDTQAWWIWLACVLFFSGPVFYVKSLLKGAKERGSLNWKRRWEIGGTSLSYHVVLALVPGVLALCLSTVSPILVAIALLPSVARGVYGWLTLSNTLPPLKRVGLLETAYAVWFVVWMGIVFAS